MKSRANYKEYVFDAILILFIVQISRMFIKYVLLSQLNTSLGNLLITSIISFVTIGIIMIMILKDNDKFNPSNIKIINMFKKDNKYIHIILGILIVLSLIISIFYGKLNKYSIELLILSIVIIPVFEELLFRQYIWNYLTNYIKDVRIVCISIVLIYAFYKIGYIDIIKQYMDITSNPGYIIDILKLNVFKGFIFGSIACISKLKFYDIYICMLLHSIFIILFC